MKALKDADFEKYIRTIHLSHVVLMKYTSRLETCPNEKKNCSIYKDLDNIRRCS